MSFSHSKRPDVFAPSNDTPGPTDYEVKATLVSDDKNKKFGFIENSKRFKSPKQVAPAAEHSDESSNASSSGGGPNLPLPPTARRPPASGSAGVAEALKYKKEAEKWQEQYERQLILHQKDMSALEDRLSRLDVALKEALREKNTLSSTAVAKEKELAELQRKHALLKTNLEKTEKQSTNLVEKATRSTLLERKITDLEKTTAKTRSLVDAKSNTLEKLEIERKELRELCDSLKKQVDELRAEKSLRDELMAEAEIQRLELSSRVQELEGSAHLSHEELAAWERKMFDVQEQCDLLQSQKMEAEARLTDVSKALDAARSEWDADKAKVEKLEALLKDRLDDLAAVELEKNQVLEQRSQLEDQVKNLLSEAEAVRESRDVISKEKDALETLLSQAQGRNEEVTGLLSRLEVSVSEKIQRIADLERTRDSEVVEYEEVIGSLKAALVRRETEADEKLQQIDYENQELRGHMETAMHEILGRDQQIEALNAQEETLRAQVEALTAELTATTELCDTWRNHFNDTDEIKTQLLQRIASMEQDLLVAAQQMQSLTAEVSASQTRIESLETEISRLNRSLEAANEALADANLAHADAIAMHESQMEELNTQLADERTYRTGEKDMAEFRIASIQASSVESLQEKAELIASLEVSIENLKTEIQAKNAELLSLADAHKVELGQVKFELSEQQDLVAEYRERAYDNEAALEESHQENETLKEKVKSAVAAAKTNRDEMEAAFRQIISEFREKVETLETEKAFVCDELEEARKSLVDHNSRLTDSDGLISLLKEKHRELESRIEILNAALGKSNETVEVVQRDLTECYDLNAQLTSQNSEKAESIHSLQSDVSALQESLDETQKANTVLQKQLTDASASLSATTSELNLRVSDLERQLQDEKASSVELGRLLEAKTSELVGILADHQEELAAKSAVLETANATISQLETTLETLTLEYDSAKSRISELLLAVEQESQSHASTKVRVGSLEVELVSEKETKLALAAKIDELEALLRAQMEVGRDMGEKVARLERVKDENEKELCQLNSAIEMEKKAHATTKQDLETALSNERDAVNTERRRSHDLSTSLETQVSLVSSMSTELGELKTLLNSETSSHAEAREKITALEGQLETEKSSLAAMIQKADDLSRGLEDEKHAHAVSLAQNTDLTAVLEVERENHRSALETVNNQLAETRSKLESAVSQAKELEASLSAEQLAHADSRRDADQKLSEFVKYHSESKENLSLLVAALEEERTMAQQKDARLLSLGNELSECKAELESNRMDLENLKARTISNAQAHDEEREAHREIVGELQGRSERLASALAEKDEAVKILETEVAAVKLRHANEVGHRDEEIRELKERMQAMELQFNEMKGNSEGVNKAKAELVATQKCAEETVRRAAEDAAEYDSLLEQNRMEIKSIKKENERLNDALIVAERRQAEVEGHLKAQVDFLEKHHKSTFDELKKLTSANADLMGHQNAQQKIRHIAKMKEELMKMKEEHSVLIRERDALRRKNMVMERDLEAFKAVVPVVSATVPCDFKFLHTASKSAPESKPSTQTTGPKKVSRIGREVLAARAKLQQVENMKPDYSVIPAVNKPSVDNAKTELVDVVAESENSENLDATDAESSSGSKHTFFVQM